MNIKSTDFLFLQGRRYIPIYTNCKLFIIIIVSNFYSFSFYQYVYF